MKMCFTFCGFTAHPQAFTHHPSVLKYCMITRAHLGSECAKIKRLMIRHGSSVLDYTFPNLYHTRVRLGRQCFKSYKTHNS